MNHSFAVQNLLGSFQSNNLPLLLYVFYEKIIRSIIFWILFDDR